MTDEGDAREGPAAAVRLPGHHHPGPPSKLARNLVIGALIALVVGANVANALLPVLVEEHPLWFIALNPSNRNLALASGELSAWSFYLVGFLRLLLPDPLFFLLGRWYGDAAIRWMERKAPVYGELLRQLEQWFDRAKVPIVAVAPNNPVCLFAGAAGMSVAVFAAANVVGTAARLVLIRLFSEAFEGPLGSLKSFIADYQKPLLVLSVAIVAFTIWNDRRGGRDGIGDLANLPEDIEEIEHELEAADDTLPGWAITPATTTGAGELTVLVDQVPVHVACADAPLADHPEAWVGAFAFPAARAGVALDVEVPVSPTWRRGAEANVAQAAGWWGGSPDLVVRTAGSAGALGRDPEGPATAGVGVCFTAGVDSFWSLLRGDHAVTHLVFVVGFDVDERNPAHFERAVANVREVAAATGTQALIVTTDLRRHPRFDSVSWEHTHGAALAAVGHLLSDTIGTLVIPPSYAQHRLVPWGSRPDLDVRWSVPGRLAVVHGDNHVPRLDRVLAVGGDPLVARHLRVCWQDTDELNCGRCEKCLRTMAMLASGGHLAGAVTFPTATDLPGALDDLPLIEPGHRTMWLDLLPHDLPADVRAAVERLLERSPGSP